MYEAIQTFTTDFPFTKIDIELRSHSCYKPSMALIELYNSGSFLDSVFNSKHYIKVDTPIARTQVLVAPGKDSNVVTIFFKKQPAGVYCWLVKNLYDGDPASAFYVKRTVPKLYDGGFSYLNRWRDDNSDYSSYIYGLPTSTERYLACTGTTVNFLTDVLTVDAPVTNPVLIEGKGEIAQVGDFVRDAKGRAVGMIVSGSEVFEQGEIITKLVTFTVQTPQKYPVYNARVLKDGIEIGRTDRQGRLIVKVETGPHIFTGGKVLSKLMENQTADGISKWTQVRAE